MLTLTLSSIHGCFLPVIHMFTILTDTITPTSYAKARTVSCQDFAILVCTFDGVKAAGSFDRLNAEVIMTSVTVDVVCKEYSPLEVKTLTINRHTCRLVFAELVEFCCVADDSSASDHCLRCHSFYHSSFSVAGTLPMS